MDSAAWKIGGPVVMTCLVGAVNVLASFTVGRWLVEYVPGIRNSSKRGKVLAAISWFLVDTIPRTKFLDLTSNVSC